MSTVFTKSAKSSAVGSFQSAAFVVVIACVFAAVGVFADSLPTFVNVIFMFIFFVCLLWAASLVRQGQRYLRSGKQWRVEVTKRRLIWQSPVQEIMASFDVLLTDILTLRHVVTKVGSKNAGPKHDYMIELRNGEIIDVSDQISGVDPAAVFDALHENGVPLEKEFIRTKEEFRKKRAQRRERKRAAKEKRRLQTAV